MLSVLFLVTGLSSLSGLTAGSLGSELVDGVLLAMGWDTGYRV